MTSSEPSGETDFSEPSSAGPAPAESLAGIGDPKRDERLSAGPQTRLVQLMLYRVALITLVLGATTLLHWLGDADLAAPSSIALYAIIATTYLATIVYALALRRDTVPSWLPGAQLAGDLIIACILVHLTGGAQSAYTFFFPLAIIGAALVTSRRGTAWVAGSAALLFVSVSMLGWFGVLPTLAGQRFAPTDPSTLELSRLLALNLAGVLGVAVLALTLSRQLQVTSASLEVERTAAADILSLHSDIVRCLSSGLVTIDEAGLLSTINDAACEILATDASTIGRPAIEVLPGLESLIEELGAEGALLRGELSILGRDNTPLNLGVSISPLFDHEGRVLGRVVNFQDLTELRHMEESVRQAERLAVVGGLAAGIAHEIRNPLASISGSVELLRSMPHVDEDSQALMSIVNREIDRLNGLLTDLLDYANPRALKFAPVNLSELVSDTVRVFLQDGQYTDLEIATDLPDATGSTTVSGDAAKLRQVTWNLLKNAADAASKGGGHVWITLAAKAECVELVVRDDGRGIALSDQQRVFEPFFTTKRTGTGLGLATVHGLVTDHRGQIEFATEEGSGTSFVVQLPYTSQRGRSSSPPFQDTDE